MSMALPPHFVAASRDRTEWWILYTVNHKANGHLLPITLYDKGANWLEGVACSHCGRRYKRRMADALRHVRFDHNVDLNVPFTKRKS